MRLATSSCNPSCQECRSITHALLRAAVPMRLVTAGCKLASRSVTANRPTFAQRQQCELFKAMLHPQFFTIFVWNQALAIVWCTVCRPHLPKVFWTPQFFTVWKCKAELSLQSGTLVLDSFPRLRPATAETETILWPPQEPHYPKKHKVSRAKPWIHMFPNCYSPLLLPHAHCSCSLYWHDDDMIRRLPLDIRPQLGSFRTKFPLMNSGQ